MTQPDELKPCPLCGGKAVLHEESATIHCVQCGLETDEDYTCAAAVKAWNTRSTPDQQAIDDVKLLRAALLLQTEVIPSYDVMERSVKALAATDRPEYKEEG